MEEEDAEEEVGSEDQVGGGGGGEAEGRKTGEGSELTEEVGLVITIQNTLCICT